MKHTIPIALAVSLCAGALLAEENDGRRYAYLSVLDGNATLVTEEGERSEAEANLPVLPGDTLALGHSARAELFLPDGTLLHAHGGTELSFLRIAWSAGVDDNDTAAQLPRGEVLATLDREAAETLIATPNATVYLNPQGRYRVWVEEDETRITVREGRAEVETDRGSTIVLAGEESVTRGHRSPRTLVVSAPPRTQLERWAQALEQGNRWEGGHGDFDDRVAYAAAPLDRYGSWVDVDGSSAWRPRNVGVDWAPYHQGRWRETSLGFTWVSSDPWGWVPYSYGSWDRHSNYGWVWYPGRRWAPAHVTWYWGPRYVGWCPTGWYQRSHYRSGVSIDIDINFRVFGWGGGRSRDWNHWNFVDYDRLRDRRVGRWARDGRGLHDAGIHDLGRGIVATDTRPFARRDRIDGRVAQEIWDHELRNVGRKPESLPDVTGVATRRPNLDAGARTPFDKPVRIEPTNPAPTATAGGRRGRFDDEVREVPSVTRRRTNTNPNTGSDDSVATKPRVASPPVPTLAPGSRPRVAPRPDGDQAPVVTSRPRRVEPADTNTNGPVVRPRRVEPTVEPNNPGNSRPVVRPRTNNNDTNEPPAVRPTVRSRTPDNDGPGNLSPRPTTIEERRELPRPTVRPRRDEGEREQAPPVQRVIESSRRPTPRLESTPTPTPRNEVPRPTVRSREPRASTPTPSPTPRVTSPAPRVTNPNPPATTRSTPAPTRRNSSNGDSGTSTSGGSNTRREEGAGASSRRRRDKDDG